MRERERILLRNISATMSTGTVTWDLLITLIANHVSKKQQNAFQGRDKIDQQSTTIDTDFGDKTMTIGS